MELLLILLAIPAFVGGYWISAQIQLADKERLERDVAARAKELDDQQTALENERIERKRELYGYSSPRFGDLRQSA